MKVLIDIKNCRECPYSWGGDMQNPHESFVCSKLADNIGKGNDIHEDCPLREYEQNAVCSTCNGEGEVEKDLGGMRGGDYVNVLCPDCRK